MSKPAEQFIEDVQTLERVGRAGHDYVAWGETSQLDVAEAADHVCSYEELGATWWIEGTSALTNLEVVRRTIRRGPPGR